MATPQTTGHPTDRSSSPGTHSPATTSPGSSESPTDRASARAAGAKRRLTPSHESQQKRSQKPTLVARDPAHAIISLPTHDSYEPYVAIEFLLLRYNPQVRGHEILTVASWKSDSITALTVPSAYYSYDGIRKFLPRPDPAAAPADQPPDEEPYLLTRKNMARAFQEVETLRGLSQGPEGGLTKHVGAEHLTILHTAHSTRDITPQHGGASRKLRVETFVLYQEYPDPLGEASQEHWNYSVSWPHSHPTPLPETSQPICVWMGVREFVAAQPYHTRLGPQTETPNMDMPRSSELWCELLVEWGGLRLQLARPTTRPAPTQGPATFVPMDRDPAHYDFYRLLSHRGLFQPTERNEHPPCMDHRNSLVWSNMGYPLCALEAAAKPCAYHFLSGGPRPTPVDHGPTGGTRYCCLRVPFHPHTMFRELRDVGIVIQPRSADEMGSPRDWKLHVPIYYPPMPLQATNKLQCVDRLVWLPDRQSYTYDTHQWDYHQYPPDGLDLLHSLIQDRFPPLMEHLDTLARLWKHDHSQVYLLYCALLGSFPVLTPLVFTFLWKHPVFASPWPGLYHYLLETMSNDTQVASPVYLPLLGAPGAPTPGQPLPLPAMHTLSAAMVQMGMPGWCIRSEPTLNYCWDSRNPSDWRNSDAPATPLAQLPLSRMGAPWNWTRCTSGTILRGLWGSHAGSLYQLSYPTEGTRSRAAHPARSVRCAWCDFVAATPHDFARHAMEKHFGDAQHHLRAHTLENWATTTMELANLMAQKTDQH